MKSGINVRDSRARAQGEIMIKRNQQVGILLSSALVLVAITVLMGNLPVKDANPDLARVEFFVS